MSTAKPKVIGLYGLPAAGKTTLIRKLKGQLPHPEFVFYDGSTVLADQNGGTLKGFNQLSDHEKNRLRGLAINHISTECERDQKTAVVAGHYMFWSGVDNSLEKCWTETDARTYTHILYLDVPAETIQQQAQDDTTRSIDNPRYTGSKDHLQAWKDEEKTELRRHCYANNILFSVVRGGDDKRDQQVLQLIQDFEIHDETHNKSCALQKVDDIMSNNANKPQTMLVIDADKTLTPIDTGEKF